MNIVIRLAFILVSVLVAWEFMISLVTEVFK